MAEMAGLHHVALSVKDVDASVAWYTEVLGLEEQLRLDSQDRRVAILCIPASGSGPTQQLGLVEHKASNQGFDPKNLGLDHVAFTATSREELQAWADLLEERGLVSSGVIETPFGGMLNFADPDGIALAVYWNR